jgi:hypothetical protein
MSDTCPSQRDDDDDDGKLLDEVTGASSCWYLRPVGYASFR